MNKKSIIFIVIAIVLIIVGFSSLNTSKQTDVISKAVYVEDGKVASENDGKIVIVSGKLVPTKPLVDEITGVELPGIKAKRNVELYQVEFETKDEKTYKVFQWKPTILGKENEFNELVSSALIADCKVGDIEIDTAVLNSVSCSKRYHSIDKNAVSQRGYFVTPYKDVTYLTKADFMPYGGEDYGASFKRNGITTVYYKDFENIPRISYTVENVETCEYTLIGRQQNGKLMYDKDIGMQAAFDGLQNPQQLSERVENGGMIGAIVAWVLAAVLILIGIIVGKKTYIPTDEDLKEIEKDIE